MCVRGNSRKDVRLKLYYRAESELQVQNREPEPNHHAIFYSSPSSREWYVDQITLEKYNGS